MSNPISANTNIRAYEAVESIENFASFDEIVAYRKRRVERYAPVVNFVAKRSKSQPFGLSVVEVGSGSSALLYGIAEKRELKCGIGIELAQSRFDFAERWKLDDGYHAVTNINQNFASVDLESSAFDWFIVIDNTFTYLYPEDTSYPEQLLRQAFNALRPGGRVLLDFINYAKRKPDVNVQQWNEFPKSDPFSFGLYAHKISNGINATERIFIKRDDGGVSRKLELSKVYSLDEISELLSECGFEVSEVFSDFNEEPYHANSSERLVVVAERP